MHAIWQDRFAGFVYASGTGSNWTEPTAVTFPFSSPPFATPANDNFNALFTPKLLLDQQGIVHAFWQMEGGLFYSNASLSEMSSSAAWAAPQSLAGSAAAHTVVATADGRLHLAYIRTLSTDEFPAGVYYRQRTEAGWSSANRLYQSSYLRTATEDQFHIQIAATSPDRLLLVWDNYLADQILYSQSSSGGSSWSEPVSIDQRHENDNPEAPGPHYLQLFTHNDDVHLLWNRYANVGRCELIHLWSGDGGREWQPRQVLLDVINCPTRRQALIDETTDSLYLLTEQEQGSIVMRAWFGAGWTPPQIKNDLASFTNPETFRTVTTGCLRPLAVQSQLLAVTCGQSNVEDIWLMTSNLPELVVPADALAEQWQLPASIARSNSNQYSPIVLPGQQGLLHAVWLEKEVGLFADDRRATIRYAYWDGTSWSRPAPIVEGEIDQLVVTISDDNRLLLAWRGVRNGSLGFTQVDAAQAAFPAQWSPAKELVVNEIAISKPALLAASDNQIYIAYALTLNEGRGIYLRHSEDGGINWSEPILAFDATEADWAMVDDPSLAMTADGSLHLMWGRYSLLAENRPLAYYYARSLDGGVTWSATPTLVAEESLLFGEVMATPRGNNVLRLWQTDNSEQSALWYQLSEDAGRTWSSAALLPGFDGIAGDVTILADPAGHLHVLHLAPVMGGEAYLNTWTWQTDSWQADIGATFEFIPAGSSPNISAAIQEDGTFLLVFAGLLGPDNNQLLESRILYTMRPITLPEVRLSVDPIIEEPTPIATPLAADAETEQPLPTPTTDLAALADESITRTQFGPLDMTTAVGRILAGVLPAVLIVVLGVALGLYALRVRES